MHPLVTSANEGLRTAVAVLVSEAGFSGVKVVRDSSDWCFPPKRERRRLRSQPEYAGTTVVELAAADHVAVCH